MSQNLEGLNDILNLLKKGLNRTKLPLRRLYAELSESHRENAKKASTTNDERKFESEQGREVNTSSKCDESEQRLSENDDTCKIQLSEVVATRSVSPTRLDARGVPPKKRAEKKEIAEGKRRQRRTIRRRRRRSVGTDRNLTGQVRHTTSGRRASVV